MMPALPFMWPDRLGLPETDAPLAGLADTGAALLGLVHGVDRAGVQFLQNLTERRPQLLCNLVVGVYAACPTRRVHLEALLELQQAFPDRVSFRILPLDINVGGPVCALFCKSQEHPDGFFSIGASPNFGFTHPQPGQANLAFLSDTEVLDSWCQWFDELWGDATPLTAASAAIPALRPVPGSADAAALWDTYVTALNNDHVEQQPDRVRSTPAAEDQQVYFAEIVVTGDAPTVTVGESPTGNIRPNALMLRIARLYEAGEVVSADPNTRIPPFSMPIRPETLGLEGSRPFGSIKRGLSYSVSPFDSSIGGSLENLRKKLPFLLGKLTFMMATNQHWIPHSVKPFLDAEMNRVNSEGMAQFSKAVANGPTTLLNSQRARIKTDLTEAYHEFRPGQPVPATVLEKVMQDLADKLEKADGRNFLPNITYSTLRFRVGDDSGGWVSPWAQPLALLHSIAQFPRLAATDDRFFWGLRVDPDELVAAMDVCNDVLLQRNRWWHETDRVHWELRCLGEIMSSRVDDQVKCDAILQFIDGMEWADIERKVLPQCQGG